MRKYMIIKAALLSFLLFAVCGNSLYGQLYPERKHIRSGNREYSKGEYAQSETEYLRALDKAPDSYEASLNMGNSLYKQQRYDEASKVFQRLAKDSAHVANAADCHYNAGNALFQQRKLKEAMEEYKNALRRNPGDMEAKFNLAYVKKLLENDDEQNNQDQDNQDDSNDKDSGGGSGGNDESDGENNQDKNDPNDGKNGQDKQEGSMGRDEAEQLLQAVQTNEDKTREKVDAQKVKQTGRPVKNW